jgi:predicted ribosome quality control (RQC) complex YloA/Tae2 family protein
MSDEDFSVVNCNECGITFKFSKKIEDMWRKSSKTFYCPNGHSLHWPKPKESDEEKELKKLRAEVNELRTKLVAAEKKAEDQKKRADELASELEIWRPTTNDKKDN